MLQLIIHMFHASLIPCISLDQYLNPNLYTISNMQNMRFFCCSVYMYRRLRSHATFKQKMCLENSFQELNHQIIYLIYISHGTGVHHNETMFRLHDLGLYVKCKSHRPLSKSVSQILLSFPSTNCHTTLYKFSP